MLVTEQFLFLSFLFLLGIPSFPFLCYQSVLHSQNSPSASNHSVFPISSLSSHLPYLHSGRERSSRETPDIFYLKHDSELAMDFYFGSAHLQQLSLLDSRTQFLRTCHRQ